MWEELRSQVPRVLAFETLDFGSFWNWTEWNFIISGGQFYYQPCSMIKLCFKTWHFTLPWYSKPAQAWDFIFLGGILPGYSERCGGLVIFCCLFFFAPRNSAMIFSTQHPHRWIFFANIRLCGRIMWCRIGRSESTDSQRSWSGAGRGVVVRPKRHKNDKFSEWILISGIAWFFKLFVELQ